MEIFWLVLPNSLNVFLNFLKIYQMFVFQTNLLGEVLTIFCQIYKKPQEQRLKERSKFNFQARNKTKLCDSK
jgi:hypothetical protein